MSNRKPQHRFPKGNKFGTGGARPGAGRPSLHIQELAKKIIEREKLIEFFGEVAAGRVMDHKVVDGEVIEVPASLYDRREYAKELFDRAFGKAPQALDIKTEKSPEEVEAENKRFARLYQYLAQLNK